MQEFNDNLAQTGGCEGFIIDLRAILKADEGEKEYFYYLMNLFPAIRISHTRDNKSVTGHIKGRLLKDRPLFDYFFSHLPHRRLSGSNIEIVMIVNTDESRKLYESYIKAYPDVTIRHYRSPLQLMEQVTQAKRYSGFLIDLRTMMKAKASQREILHSLIESFPVARLTHSLDQTSVNGNIRDRNLRDNELFDYFINDLCRHFIPRGVRIKKRARAFFNLNLHLSLELEGERQLNPVEVNTIDVSEDGSFILSTLPLKKDDRVQVVIKELTDPTAIQCRVKWVLPWGVSFKHLPGFGVSFVNMKPNQREELVGLVRGRI